MKANMFKTVKVKRQSRLKVSICYKVSYRKQETAERKAASAHDLRGDYVAYKCDQGNHWHIGHSLEQQQW